jgi:predicted phosphodiesterase
VRIAVLSDVHGNLEALQAVLERAEEAGADSIVCLGDVVGYGPDPAACVELIDRVAGVCIQGNHDRAALPEERPFRRLFRRDARVALDWTEGQLDGRGFAILRRLPKSFSSPWGLLAHGSPSDPMRYVLHEWDMKEVLAEAASWEPAPGLPLLWVGHTHLPVLVGGQDGAVQVRPRVYGQESQLGEGWWLLNPGSVGQPRDGDPRARWALLDVPRLGLRLEAVEYDYRKTQDKMRAAGLPEELITLLGPTRAR